MQREKARDGFLSTKGQEGLQTMQEQADSENKQAVQGRIERKGATSLFA